MKDLSAVANALDGLRTDLFAERVTLRLDVEGRDFPIIAESVSDGVQGLSNDESVGQGSAATAQWVIQTLGTLVQDDVAMAEPAPPKALVELYGVRAQILAPVLWCGQAIGWVSVHAGSPRAWSERDVAAVEQVAYEVARGIDELGSLIEVCHGPLRGGTAAGREAGRGSARAATLVNTEAPRCI